MKAHGEYFNISDNIIKIADKKESLIKKPKILGVSGKFPQNKDHDKITTFMYVNGTSRSKEKMMKMRANLMEYQ